MKSLVVLQGSFLDGNHDGEEIVLVESDSLGRSTGIIKGDMNDDKFYCSWSDVKNIEQYPLFLFRSKGLMTTLAEMWVGLIIIGWKNKTMIV